MPNYQAESFYRAKISTSITSTAVCPITIALSKLPTTSTWLLTISPNTEFEEIVEYGNIDAVDMTIDITKRWIKPTSTLLTTDTVDYNNTTYQFAHTQNDIIRWDVNHIHINQAIGNTTLATEAWVGISKLSVAAANPADPIVVWTNDPRLNRKVWSYYWNITSGATLDNTPRNIAAFGTDWDNEVAFTGTAVTGLASMTGTITNNSYATSIVLGNWDRCRVSIYPAVSTTVFRVVQTWWATRILGWANIIWGDLSSSSPSTTFMNASASDMTITLQVANSGWSGLFKAWILIEIF